MDKYKNKYRISSARAQWWDYSRDAAYFVTICTRCRECFFGEIQNDQMILSPAGRIADFCWVEITEHAKNIELGPYVVMPNHVHGIVNLKGNQVSSKCVRSEQVETRQALSLQAPPLQMPPIDQPPKTIGQMRFQNPGKNTISTIIGGYKSAVSGKIHPLRPDFGWQARFHDHIIRDEEEYQRIDEYILNNPANWKEDKFYSG
ncbi:MAG: transposase [Cyclobacteriaceae bacterium]